MSGVIDYIFEIEQKIDDELLRLELASVTAP